MLRPQSVMRMKYSGSDFKMTSQANHMEKLMKAKKEYVNFLNELQSMYVRRVINKDGTVSVTPFGLSGGA